MTSPFRGEVDVQHPTLDACRAAAVSHGRIKSYFSYGLGSILYYGLLLLTTFLIPPATAVSVNITVDDTFGNSDGSVIPTYLPVNDSVWHIGSPSEQCDICVINPSMLNTSQIVDQSWHHATPFVGTPIQVQVTFPGTAVYVYNVVPNTLPNGSAMTMNISFALDGETVGQFVHFPDTSSDILYHHLVYANASLSDGRHTFVMSAPGTTPSLIFFDYLLYTTEAEGTTTSTSATAVTSAISSSPAATTPSSSSSATSAPSNDSSARRPTAAIVGGVIGGVAVLLVGAALLFLVFNHLRRRRRRSHPLGSRSDTPSADAPTPSTATPASFARPISADLFSNTATVGGPSLAFATIASPSSIPSRPSDLKRGAALAGMRRHDALRPEMDAATRMAPSQHQRWEEQRSEYSHSMSEGLGTGTVHALHGEIAALRGLLSAMAVRGRLTDNQPAMSEVLPRYEA